MLVAMQFNQVSTNITDYLALHNPTLGFYSDSATNGFGATLQKKNSTKLQAIHGMESRLDARSWRDHMWQAKLGDGTN
mgnify:FL=1